MRRLETIIAGRDELTEASSSGCATSSIRRWRSTGRTNWGAAFEGDDLVIFDSSRVALSSVGLSEDVNDDYARFVNRLVMPLSRAGTTTVILDNSGHEGGHPRGASAKSDLNEVVFELRVAQRRP